MKRNATPIIKQPAKLNHKRARRWVTKFNASMADAPIGNSSVPVNELSSPAPGQTITTDMFAVVSGDNVLAVELREQDANAWLTGHRRIAGPRSPAQVRAVSATLTLK